MLLNSLALLSPDQKYPSTLSWIHKYATFVMHNFQGCRASLESLCNNFGGELSTIATLMFVVLHVLFNDLVRSLIFHWVYTILFILRFQIFQQIRMINTLVHNFEFSSFNDFDFVLSRFYTFNEKFFFFYKFERSIHLMYTIFSWIFTIL